MIDKNEWLNAEHISAFANKDAEFLLQARLWNAKVALINDQRAIVLTIAQGRVMSADSASADALSTTSADVRIGAPASDWDAMLRPIPRPFYQDVRAAAVHHGFRIEGDVLHTGAYYPAIRRLIELMREVRNAAL